MGKIIIFSGVYKIEYKLIFVDLDDSLLGNDLKISQQNKSSINKAIKKGVKVIITTGRMYKAALPFHKELDLDTPIVSFQGALIKNPCTEEILFYKPLDIEQARQVLEFGEQLDIHMQIYHDDGYYVKDENKYSKMYQQQNKIKPFVVGKSLTEFLSMPPAKIIFIDEPNRILKIYNDIATSNIFSGEQLSICTSKPHYLEFNRAGITKGHGVEFLCDYYGASRKQAIAIGDSYNDLPMIKQAGLGVAVGNAAPDIIEEADYVTATNEEQGVAEVINRFVL
ncbi:MAG: Cof-type HAD-IIB family hydrolase [Clostridia bacterium]|nr:Cof-type HAD-IIB family hydrolase [Clostridia bacterium]